jgi:hypothetical protein
MASRWAIDRTPFNTRPSRADVAGVGLATAGLVAVIWTITFAAEHSSRPDFFGYLAYTQNWLSAGSIYSDAQLRGPYVLATGTGLAPDSGPGSVYPPPAVLFLTPLAFMGYAGFSVLSIAFLFGGLLAIVSERRRVTPAWIGAIAVLAYTPSFMASVMVGSVTTALTGALAWAYVGRAGVWGAIGGLIRLTPASIAALDGIHGILYSIGTIAVFCIVSLPIVGISSWQQYGTVLSNTRPLCSGAISIACLTGSTTLALAIGVALTVSCLLTTSRTVRLALVTGSLLATSMELQPIGPNGLYLAPLMVAGAVALAARTDEGLVPPQ